MRCRWLLVALFLTGCASHSLEVGRPLVVARIPSSGPDFEALREHFPGYPSESLARSLKLSSSARNVFDIHKHNDWTSFVPIGNLVRAIDLVPDNPFAWIQLGGYLALNHQTQAAIMATTRGLESIDAKCGATPCPESLRKLREVGALNLAIYSSDAERPLEALLALDSIELGELPLFEQVAYHWTAAATMSALGDVDGAREELRQAAAIPEAKLLEDPRPLKKDYPQYFDDDRQAVELYLDAVIDTAAGQPDSAEAKLRKAIALDAELWDAHVLLSTIQHQRGNYGAAIETLTNVLNREWQTNSIFRPERLSYNLGSAYLARYESGKNTSANDLDLALGHFESAARQVEQRFRREQVQARLAGLFNTEAAASFFLDAMATMSPVYADACNNLGTVYARRAEVESSARAEQFRSAAEEQWHRALRDHYWPRRHLAYGNLAAMYAKTGRLARAAEAASAALDADPFNVVPIRALLDLLKKEPPPPMAVEAAQIAARLIAQRRLVYPVGTFDELLAEYDARLDALPPSDEVQKTKYLLAYVRAADAEVEKIIADAHAAFPEWSWPAVAIARKALANGDAAPARALVERLGTMDVPLHDWLAKREEGDLLLLRAEVRAHARRYREARRDIERAIGSGVGTDEVEELRQHVDETLRQQGEPIVSSLAVAPFDTIHLAQKGPIGHALAASFSTLFRGAGGATVRYLERDAVDVADWNPQSAIEAGRASGIGAVLTGRYAKGRDHVHIDARVFDSVSGEQLFGKIYAAPRDQLLAWQARIANDIAGALHLQVKKPFAGVAEEAFTANPDAYGDYHAGMDILLSGYHGGQRDLERAGKSFDRAIDADEKFARARAARAYTLYALANLYESPAKILPAAQADAKDAVRDAPGSAEAQLAAALLQTWFAWDLEAGRKAFEEAVRLDPMNATIHRLYGDYFLATGDLPNAMKEKREALRLSPRSAAATVDLGNVFFYQHDYEQALAQADAALALKPDMADAYELKAWAYAKMKQYDAALDALDAGQRRAKRPLPLLIAHRGVIAGLRKNWTEADTILDNLRQISAEERAWVLPLLEARVLAARGREDEALEKLWEAHRHRSESIVWLRVDPWFDSVREHPRFRRLLELVGPR